eukprot:CAMPEP_0168499970 /NCGR_PEP_ID=MMETSP0228-20121227/74048_1 /TAXON_ID=133427 /ORGANISM="Protoceratium reticulatum, Strain CCCM 535 (=CCMP 1889)" /LENGTH=30 /DNA_ID= /DNA_START= /DNA_END= /DNA_ORIENTATION=
MTFGLLCPGENALLFQPMCRLAQQSVGQPG